MKKPLAPELEPLIAEVIKHWLNEQPQPQPQPQPPQTTTNGKE